MPFPGATTVHRGKHTAGTNVPSLHVLSPDSTYPESHSGVHVSLCRSVPGQAPSVPFAGATTVHTGEQTAGTNAPSLQVLSPDSTYPESHSGVHVSPLCNSCVQLPSAPFAGAITMHGRVLFTTPESANASAIVVPSADAADEKFT